MPSISIKVSIGNRLHGLQSSRGHIPSDSHLILLLDAEEYLSDAEEFLLCDCPMVIDYILEINHRTRQKLRIVLCTLMIISNQNRYRRDKMQMLSFAMSNISNNIDFVVVCNGYRPLTH